MKNLSHYIKSDLNAARDQFLSSCNAIGLRVRAYEGVGTGTKADNQPIYADVALAGSPDAASLLILAPAAGMAGFITSAIATAFLRDKLYLDLPRHVACLMIHAINPKGPIWPSFSLIQDNHPLPPANAWEDELLANAEAKYIEVKQLRQQGLVLDRAKLSSLPLSAMAMPGWDENAISDIERRFMQDRLQITLIDFKQEDIVKDNRFEIDYSERSIIADMGNLQDSLDVKLNRVNFKQIASAGLIDRAGSHANALQFRANIENIIDAGADFSSMADVMRALMLQMPKG